MACNNLTKKDWFHSLPFQQFQALLALFSKSFSPFPHGTCLLSVSNQYLALDEIYHPICAPIPRSVTLRTHAEHGGLQMTDGTLTLIEALFQEAYICASVGRVSRDYNSRPEGPNFHAELIPVHSPLLRESYLVSYPPLTYMLKFSGFANLTSCRKSLTQGQTGEGKATQLPRAQQTGSKECSVSWRSQRSLVN